MSDNTNNNRPFLAFSTGTVKDGKPYAFHLEGYLTKDPEYFAGNEGKKGYLRISTSVGRNPWLMLGEDIVAEQAANPHVNEESPFVELTVFSPLAEEYKDRLTKGSKIAFCGRPSKNEFTRKADNTSGANVKILVDGLRMLSCRQTDGDKQSSAVYHAISEFPRRDGTRGTSAMAMLVTGKVLRTESVKVINGSPSIGFELELDLPATKMAALAMGEYTKDAVYGKYKRCRCTVWGNRASSLSRPLAEGNLLAVTGGVSTKEYNGETYVNISVRELSVMNWAESNAAAPSGASAPAASGAPASAYTAPAAASGYPGAEDYGDLMGEGDDELPF